MSRAADRAGLGHPRLRRAIGRLGSSFLVSPLGGIEIDESGQLSVKIVEGGGIVTESGGAAVEGVTFPATNDEVTSLTPGEVVYVSGTDAVERADNSASATALPAGVAAATIAAGATGRIRQSGVQNGYVGLTPGVKYWLGTGGAITATAPTGSGDYVVQVGKALSATELLVEIKERVQLA